MKRLITQFIKFGMVGGIAFAIDYGLFGILGQGMGVPLLIANTLSFTVSVIFNYVASMKFVFDGREDLSKAREFIIFLILSVIGLVINNGILFLTVKKFGIHAMVAKIFATVVVMIWNFCSRKILLEKKPNDGIMSTN